MKGNICEEILLNQWQPLQTMLYDGWVLRFANGYTKRANSVNPIYYSQEDIYEKIRHCERIYAAHRLKTIFKITPFIQPTNLDDILENEGYSIIDPTSVRSIELKQIKEPVIHTVQILGIFDIVTRENFRNQGFGEQLLLHILHWGRDHGADVSYLAVL
jgi:GNAT superfamily N-acetyltransferase